MKKKCMTKILLKQRKKEERSKTGEAENTIGEILF
jgi:hypothetical protein